MPPSPESIDVLHVDDDSAFVDLSADILERRSDRLRVSTTTKPSRALDTADEMDCIVADYDMPRMDGIELLTRVRDRYPDIPFLLFTGKGSETVASEAITAGATDYIQKKSGTDQFELLVNRIINAVEATRSERALESTRQQLEQIVGQNLVGVYLIQDGAFQYVNETLAATHGYDPTELVGASPLALVAPEDRDRVRENLHRRLAGEIPDIQYSITGLHRNGERIDVELHGGTIEYQGRPAVAGVELDVTERKRRERELRRLVSNLPGMAYRCAYEPGWPMEVVRGNVSGLSGYSPDELLDDSISWGADVVHPDDRQQVWDDVCGAVESDEPFTTTYRIRTQAGDVKWVWEQGQAIRDSDGTVTALEGFVTDITERKRQASELTLFRELIDVSNAFIYVNDAESGEIVYLNETAADRLGCDRDEFLETPVWELEDRFADRDEWERHMDELREERRMRFEGEQVDHQGNTFPVEVDLAYVSLDDDYVVAIARDIADRLEAEAKLEQQNDRLEEFVGVVSHDLRNPLNVATGRLSLIAEDCDSDHLQPVEAALDRMDRMITDLLQLALEGESAVSAEPIDLETVVEQSWDSVETGAASLVVDTETTIVADRGRLQQLLENLIRNAIEHVGDDVTVTVGDTNGGFFVEDDGDGIPPTRRDAVFDIGYTTKEDGTGFGLNIVSEIATAHDWSVVVEEGSSGGARFEITGVEIATPTT